MFPDVDQSKLEYYESILARFFKPVPAKYTFFYCVNISNKFSSRYWVLTKIKKYFGVDWHFYEIITGLSKMFIGIFPSFPFNEWKSKKMLT